MKVLWLIIWNGLLGRPFKIGNKVADLMLMEFDTPPAVMLNEDFRPGYRVAKRDDLEEFLKVWGSFLSVHAVGADKAETTMFGPIVPVLGIVDGTVEQVNQNLFHGIPKKTMFLFIKK